MRNQKQINVAKFERMLWRKEEGVFYGRQAIYRKPFGDFDVHVRIEIGSGKVSVEVSNYLEYLDWEREYDDFGQAIEGIRKRFSEIDEIAKTVRERDEEIKEGCRKLTAQALAAAMEERRQRENGAGSYEQ